MKFFRQIASFVGIGVIAAIIHFGLLIGLVEGRWISPVPATLIGYIAGGMASYLLNRRHTYASTRGHGEAGWRFAVVAGVGFILTSALMALLNGLMGLHYLGAQLITTGIVLIWSFLAHKYWSFRDRS